MKTQLFNKNSLSAFSVHPLSLSEEISVEGGGEPGYYVGYYAQKACEEIQSTWNSFCERRAKNYEKYGPWIG